MSESIIQIQHLSKDFGGGENQVHALRDINLDIRQGEIFGIIGLSGAGKSTLVRCMNLLERPTSGAVIVDGKDMTALSEKELRLQRRKMTMIFQSFNLLMQRTCLKNVRFPMEIAGVPKARAKKRAEELLDIVGLADKAGAYPSQLSGGQKQRVAVARALATDPKVLLCDEATSALDPTTTVPIPPPTPPGGWCIPAASAWGSTPPAPGPSACPSTAAPPTSPSSPPWPSTAA